LEAILKGCKPISLYDSGAVLFCKHQFHREQLEQEKDTIEEILGTVEVYPTWDSLIDSDPLVSVAVKEFGGRVII
jgi:hypothetical protein